MTRLRIALASIARPVLALAAGLTATGAVAASAGAAAGWWVYLAGFAVAAVAVPSVWALHHGRIGRAGHAAFGLLTAALVVGVPVIAMVAAFVSENWALHDVLMPYAMTPLGMFGLFGTLAGFVFAGIAIARAGVLPPAAGWCLAAAPFVDLPVELGLLPLPVWGLAVLLLAAGFVLAARAIGARPVVAGAPAAA